MTVASWVRPEQAERPFFFGGKIGARFGLDPSTACCARAAPPDAPTPSPVEIRGVHTDPWSVGRGGLDGRDEQQK